MASSMRLNLLQVSWNVLGAIFKGWDEGLHFLGVFNLIDLVGFREDLTDFYDKSFEGFFITLLFDEILLISRFFWGVLILPFFVTTSESDWEDYLSLPLIVGPSSEIDYEHYAKFLTTPFLLATSEID